MQPDPHSLAEPRRRAVLGILLGLPAWGLLAACTSDADPGDAGAPPDPDLDLIAELLADKRTLVADYLAALADYPDLPAAVDTLRRDHEAHLLAVQSLAGPTSPATAAPQPSAAPTPTAPTTGADPPPSPTPTPRVVTLERLLDATDVAAARRIRQCERARNTGLARLIAALGGCEAAHLPALAALVAAEPGRR